MAQGSRILGLGRLFSNDLLGDGQDRWRSGATSFSVLTGQGWDGGLTAGPVLEFWFRTVISKPGATDGRHGDRPQAGALSMGLHHHANIGPTEVSLGFDPVLDGPQAGQAA